MTRGVAGCDHRFTSIQHYMHIWFPPGNVGLSGQDYSLFFLPSCDADPTPVWDRFAMMKSLDCNDGQHLVSKKRLMVCSDDSWRSQTCRELEISCLTNPTMVADLDQTCLKLWKLGERQVQICVRPAMKTLGKPSCESCQVLFCFWEARFFSHIIPWIRLLSTTSLRQCSSGTQLFREWEAETTEQFPRTSGWYRVNEVAQRHIKQRLLYSDTTWEALSTNQ